MNIMLTDPSTGSLSIVKNGADASGPLGNNTLGIAPNITIASGAQIKLNNAGTYNNNISIAGIGPLANEAQAFYGALNLSVANVTVAGTVTLSADARITGRGDTSGSSISGQITGAHALELGKSGQASILLITNPANNWTGNTTISMGTTRIGAASTATTGVIPHGAGYGNVLIHGGDENNDGSNSVIDLNGFDLAINGLSADGILTRDTVTNTNGTNANGTNTFSVGDNNQTSSYAGTITNAVSLNKIGTGTLTVTAANTYFGTTTVSNGTLALGISNSISSTSALVIGDATSLTGGTLSTGGFNQDLTGNNASLTLAHSSTIDFGAGASILKLVNSSSNTWTPVQTLTIANWTYGSDHLQIGNGANNDGGPDLTPGQLAEITFSHFEPGAFISASTGEVTPIPYDINQDGHITRR